MVFIFCVLQSKSYAQETDWSIVVVPVKSNMLSEAVLERQLQLELDQINALDEPTLETLYQELPDHSSNEIQSRTMTWETQKACRGVDRNYEVSIQYLALYNGIAYWDFGDGRPSKQVPFNDHEGVSKTNYTYQAPGMYTIKVNFYDNNHQPSGELSKQIKVIVDVCSTPIPPQLAVNPNIHKAVVR